MTTISADIHKYGYTPKGASVILHRDKASRNRQTFVFDGWSGGLYASSGLLGTKPGGPIAAAWASFQLNGIDGFRRRARAAYDVRAGLETGVRAVPGLTVLGQPEVTLCAISAGEGSDVDVFAVADALWERGWHLDRQGPPDSLHATCTPVQASPVLDEFLADLGDIVAQLGGTRTDDRSTNYAVME